MNWKNVRDLNGKISLITSALLFPTTKSPLRVYCTQETSLRKQSLCKSSVSDSGSGRPTICLRFWDNLEMAEPPKQPSHSFLPQPAASLRGGGWPVNRMGHVLMVTRRILLGYIFFPFFEYIAYSSPSPTKIQPKWLLSKYISI